MKFKKWFKKNELSGKVAKVANLLAQITGGKNVQAEGALVANDAQRNSEAMWGDSQFLAWLGKHGVQWSPGKLPKHSDGGVGRAYFLGDKVVKFTNNRVEANVANMVSGNLKSPTRIIGVYRVPARQLWAILQDKVDMNLPEKIKKASDLLMTYVSDTDIDEFPKSDSERASLASLIVRNYADYGATSADIPFIIEMIDVMDRLYSQTGFFHDDAVPQNIGMYNNKVVIPDLGPNQPKTFNARKALDKIHTRRQKLGLPSYDEI